MPIGVHCVYSENEVRQALLTNSSHMSYSVFYNALVGSQVLLGNNSLLHLNS